MNKRTKQSKLFLNTETAAYYDPFSLIINLSRYKESDFSSIDIEKPSEEHIDEVALFEHELTHWLDHVSTIWGQKNLVLLFNALNARANEDIEEFWRIKTLSTSFDSDDFFDYFTEEYNLHDEEPKSPWGYQISSGIRFSEQGKPDYNKPILFVRFNCFDNIPLVRIPVSVASILESNAINSEFSLKEKLAENITDFTKKENKLKDVKSEWHSILYDKDFVLYTVIAHLTANLNNQSDITWTYNVSSAIGTTVLNLPSDFYSKMKLTHIGVEEWDRRIKDFSKNKDYGFAFYNLLKNLIDSEGEKKYSLESLLKHSGLPDESVFEEKVINEMTNNISQLIDGPFKKVAEKTILDGIEVFKIRGIDGKKENFRENLFKLKILPLLSFKDTEYDESTFDITNILKKLNSGSQLSLEEQYLTSEFYDLKFNEFVNACGV